MCVNIFTYVIDVTTLMQECIRKESLWKTLWFRKIRRAWIWPTASSFVCINVPTCCIKRERRPWRKRGWPHSNGRFWAPCRGRMPKPEWVSEIWRATPWAGAPTSPRFVVGQEGGGGRLVRMTESGRHVWNVLARPKIRSYYERALSDFSIGDMAHSLHYLLKLLENMKKLDGEEESSSLDNDPAAQRGAI